MKKLGALLLLCCLLPFVAAVVEVKAPDTKPLLIIGSENESVSYLLTLTNTGPSDEFQIYSLVGVTLAPSSVHLESAMPTTITLTASPVKQLLDNARGAVKFEYEIYSTRTGASKHALVMELAELKDVVFIRPISIEPGDTTTQLSVQNLKGETLSNLKLSLNSELINTEKILTLEPYQTINVTLPIDTDAAKQLIADTYPLRVDIEYRGAKDRIISNVKYLEKGGVAVAESHEGTIIRTKLVEKINEGNIPVTVTITEKRDIFTRLLTNHDPSPETVSKRGFYVLYTWQKTLAPSEKLVVRSTTNYTLPMIILLAIIILVIIVKLSLRTSLTLVKRVSFVRTKGGEFALKVTLHAKAHKNVTNVVITDRIPHAMKLYQSYGIKPHAINESARTLAWHLTHLNVGEERVFSYIIYSKLRVVGSFELPATHVAFNHNGKQQSVLSNKTSFASEITQVRE